MPSTLPRLLLALLKHQAKQWLGEEALSLAAQTLLDEELQTRLDAWLTQEETARRLLQAAERAHRWLQDPHNCPDDDLRALFRDLPFGDLPTVQQALADLPQAMDTAALTQALDSALARDLPTLPAAQRAEAARLLQEALLRALLPLRDFTLPVIAQISLQILAEQRREFAALQRKADELLQRLQQGQPADPTALAEAIRSGQIIVYGDIQNSVLLIGAHNQVTLNAAQLATLRERVTLPGDLPPGSYLPFPRNPYFTGREAELRRLAEMLCGEENAPSQAIALTQSALVGKGGVGKTQLAIEFAWRYGYRFRSVHWLGLARQPGDTRPLLALADDAIAYCGAQMGLAFASDDPAQRAAQTLEAWKASGPRLLILDNLEDIEQAPRLLARLSHSALRLLLTSRQHGWDGLGIPEAEIQTFTLQESLDFLRRRLPPELTADEDALRRLHERLGGLPLALDMAAAYLRETRLPIPQYLERLSLQHRSLTAWRARHPNPTGYERGLAEAFALSWERIGDESARRLFLLSAYDLPNEPLREDVLRDALGLERAEGEERYREARARLQALSLWDEAPALHPLLAEFARLQDTDEAALFAWARAFAWACYPGRSDLGIYHDPDLARRAARLLPHLRRAAEAKQDAEASALRFHTAFLLRHFGDLDRAMNLYQQSLEIQEGLGDLQGKAATLHEMAYILRLRGELERAMQLYQQSLEIKEALGDRKGKAATLHEMAYILRVRGDLDGAMNLYQQAREILEGLGDLQGKAATLHEMAGIYVTRGDLNRAMQLYQQSLEIDEALGDLKGKSATLHEMANILRLRGELERAMNLYQQSLEIDEALGDLKGKSATLHAMAYIHVTRGELERAMNLYQQSLEIKEAMGDRQGKSATLHEMAGIYVTRGDLDGAMNLYQQSLKIFEGLGDLQGKAATLHAMAGIYVTRGDLDGAMNLYQQAREILEGLGDLQGKATTLHNMAQIYVTRGDLDGAMSLYQQSLEIKEALGDRQGKAATLHEMAGIYVTRGDLNRAMQLYQQSLEIQEGLGDLQGKAATLHEMAYILRVRGDLDGAMNLYQQSLEIDEGLGDRQGKSATLHEMANILRVRGDLDGAMRLYQQSLEIKEGLGDLQGKAATLHEMAYILRVRGDLDGAMRLYQQSFEIKEALGDLQGKSATLAMLAQVHILRGEHEIALRALLLSLELLTQIGATPDVQTVMEIIADFCQELGAEAFDALWRQVTGGQPLPDWLASP